MSQHINTFGADWRIYAFYVQMHRVLIDAYMCHSIECTEYELMNIQANVKTFLILICLQQKFPQIFLKPRHINSENSIQIDQKLLELWSLAANHLARPLQDFFKKLGANSCFIAHNNIFCTHFVAVKIYNNVCQTYLHNPWNFQVIWERTSLVMHIVIQQHFPRPRLQHFL